jgi:hypothetical protein
MSLYPLARRLFMLGAERAHALTLDALDRPDNARACAAVRQSVAALPTKALGLTFPNPVGWPPGWTRTASTSMRLRAGLRLRRDRHHHPAPAAGNPQPRLFRLPGTAIINRMGFNNAGVDALVRNVGRARRKGLLGINIGKNKDTPNEQAVDDYIACLDKVYPLADYITVNISSPTPPACANCRRNRAAPAGQPAARPRRSGWPARHGRRAPMLVKVAPDLSEPTSMPPRACWATSGGRRDRHQHHHRTARWPATRWPTRPAACPARRCWSSPRWCCAACARACPNGPAGRRRRHPVRCRRCGQDGGRGALVQCYSGLIFRGLAWSANAWRRSVAAAKPPAAARSPPL